MKQSFKSSGHLDFPTKANKITQPLAQITMYDSLHLHIFDRAADSLPRAQFPTLCALLEHYWQFFFHRFCRVKFSEGYFELFKKQ